MNSSLTRRSLWAQCRKPCGRCIKRRCCGKRGSGCIIQGYIGDTSGRGHGSHACGSEKPRVPLGAALPTCRAKLSESALAARAAPAPDDGCVGPAVRASDRLSRSTELHLRKLSMTTSSKLRTRSKSRSSCAMRGCLASCCEGGAATTVGVVAAASAAAAAGVKATAARCLDRFGGRRTEGTSAFFMQAHCEQYVLRDVLHVHVLTPEAPHCGQMPSPGCGGAVLRGGMRPSRLRFARRAGHEPNLDRTRLRRRAPG